MIMAWDQINRDTRLDVIEKASLLSKVDNVVWVQLKVFSKKFTAHKIFLEYSQGSTDECKRATMLEF
jgi:hypothetical protein